MFCLDVLNAWICGLTMISCIFHLVNPQQNMGNLWESLGYDVFSWFPQASKICRITFSTWDFGGQSGFHNLHHLFLSRYSVYLVVFKMPHMMKDPQRAVEMIRYWLNSLALHAKGAPILLVGTHKDQVSWPMGTERWSWMITIESILLRENIRYLGSFIVTAAAD